jgi:hypothetical protein
MVIKGSQRIDQQDFDLLNSIQRRVINSFLKPAPGWCEISYLNTFDAEGMELREYLLGWIFSSIMDEHGFAYRLAKIGASKYSDPLFKELMDFSRDALSKGYWRLAKIVIKRAARLIVGR